MKKLLNCFVLLLLPMLITGCIVSTTPDQMKLVIAPGDTITFTIVTFPDQVEYIWYVDNTEIPNEKGNTFSYTFTEENPDLKIAVKAAGIFTNDQYEWAVVCNASEKEFAENMNSLLQTYNIPSISACIIKKENNGIWDVVWKGTYGNRIATVPKKKADNDTIYPVCSITKTFTATAVMQLAEQGLVDLDTDISNYLGLSVQHPGKGDGEPDNPPPPVTLRLLLSHRSGLADTPMDFFFKYVDVKLMELGSFSDREQLKKYLEKDEAWAHQENGLTVYYEPGEKFVYSNVGYMVLEFVIEYMTGMTWEEFIRENIFEPLGMYNSGFYWSDYSCETKNPAQAYQEQEFIYNSDEDIRVPQDPAVKNFTLGLFYNAGGPAGTIKCNIADLAFFMTAHLNKGNGYKRDDQGNILYNSENEPITIPILTAQSIEAMQNLDNNGLCPVMKRANTAAITGMCNITGYGMGWMRINLGGRYWNYPWNPELNPEVGVDWEKLGEKGIMRNEIWQENGQNFGGGLDVLGHGGDLPGYHTAMFQVSDKLAVIYLMNENYSKEYGDEHFIQPEKFAHYTTVHDGESEINYYDPVRETTFTWALPHYLIKNSEIEYLLFQKAASF